MIRAFKLFPFLLVLLFAPAVLAQANCPAIIATALAAVDSACNETARNQLCYGNIILKATPRDEAATLQFEKSGDKVGITDVKALQLSSFSLKDEEWGVALMKLQANLPDTLPGQNVIFLLFGDVSMTDASEKIVELPLVTTGGVNVRLLPTTKAGVIQSLKTNQRVTATGRLPDRSWIRVRLDNGTVGWVSGDYLSGNIGSLTAIKPNDPVFGPMQAFYFTSGHDDAPCDKAPDSGILIQTPKGAGNINLRANQVDIQLGSTVYLQTVSGDAMYVSVVEGHATLTASGTTQVVPAGTVGRVPLDANGVASGPPERPKPYDFQRLQNLPVNLKLFASVSIPKALVSSQIDDAIAKLVDSGGGTTVQATSVPPGGGGSAQNQTPSGVTHWKQNEVVTFTNCPGPSGTGSTNTWYPTIVFSPDRQSITYDGGPNNTTVTVGKVGENVYQGVYGEETLTFTFTSPTSYNFSWVGVHGDPNNGGCRFEMSGSSTLVSGG
jgi:hypothetical protein